MLITNGYGLDISHIKNGVVSPALKAVGLDEGAAINLVTGTAIAESHCRYLYQFGGGPALGLWQMEPDTHKDIWVNFLYYHKDLAAKINFLMTAQDRKQQLVTNLAYAAVMCRILYLRSSLALPNAADAKALSLYHKQVYNTAQGKADPERNVQFFADAIAA
ncbi:hypothetical protein JGUZn3_09440 [Entomobacter blattae]|uniref:Transglycosylase SLT domain-containing protein n=2 Tax=Entomobacter blattae TaxID=2762277 RepID=A0A7H1NQW5_9PROT|nr:hypothetical protein [Entomobacter blattae]QNT78175.1 hypothetical protein JGUZn3_09440 [Entomobacter blattae]